MLKLMATILGFGKLHPKIGSFLYRVLLDVIVFLAVWAFLSPIWKPAFGQTDIYREAESEKPRFYADWITFRSDKPDRTVLEIYLKVTNDQLQFIKDSGKFKASYEISATLYDSNDQQVAGRSWEGQALSSTYEETGSTLGFQIESCVFLLMPGRYKLVMRMTDLDSKKTTELKDFVDVPDYSGPDIKLSGIEFCSYIYPDSVGYGYLRGGKRLIPIVLQSYGELVPEVAVYFEVYNIPKGGLVNLKYAVLNPAGKRSFLREETLNGLDDINSQSVNISVTGMEEGTYLLEVVGSDTHSGKENRTSGNFRIGWSYLYYLNKDYKLAIDQLRYIASPSELKKVKKVKKADREKAWFDFWKSKDPTPGTPENELLVEYYRRLRYANEHFTTFIPGWKADMGMIYITYGPPSEIQRHSFELSERPYEVWYYYSSNRKFFFVDKRGFGQYELEEKRSWPWAGGME